MDSASHLAYVHASGPQQRRHATMRVIIRPLPLDDGDALSSGQPTLTDHPFPYGAFDGVLSWYSTIHTPDAELPRVLAQVRRIVKPGGHVLLAFQAGSGVVEVSGAYRQRGLDITLYRHDRSVDAVAAAMGAAGLVEVGRLERAAVSHERTAQAVVIARRPVESASSAEAERLDLQH
ncbi:hypothetical protein BKD30_07595 [Tersicoccus phoenicis]|uniref:Methyltransferase domain-containing protein n=1 Tax=Tersicoccus phoenicis TaxID=554083 RepID=A0A1R1LB41_9MICC|nr:class I SAM-dependent methyltransferase [Tersicoccus phoenicis]OMH24726.1 hypothetical protein BKD30_07595 [Tersicoccus phoenicis]